MSRTRLNGLALLNIHSDTSVSPEEILDDLALDSKRRINLRLQM